MSTAKTKNKLAEAYEIIGKAEKNFRNPAIMWSGGKDSMVLLALIRSHFRGRIPCPVIFHREPFFPKKFAFHRSVEEQWGFCAIDYSPLSTSLQKNNGVLEIVRQYQVGPRKTCRVPVSHYEDGMKPGEFLCGLDDLMKRPAGTFNYPWDLAFVGHKSCDSDAFMGGGIPLHADFKLNVGAANLAFPLRNWTHEDVWHYIEEHDVPYDSRRYDIEARTERKNRALNSDWYQCCVRCMDKDGPKSVDCPKLGMRVDNISDQLPYTPPPKLDYCEEREGSMAAPALPAASCIDGDARSKD